MLSIMQLHIIPCIDPCVVLTVARDLSKCQLGIAAGYDPRAELVEREVWILHHKHSGLFQSSTQGAAKCHTELYEQQIADGQIISKTFLSYFQLLGSPQAPASFLDVRTLGMEELVPENRMDVVKYHSDPTRLLSQCNSQYRDEHGSVLLFIDRDAWVSYVSFCHKSSYRVRMFVPATNL